MWEGGGRRWRRSRGEKGGEEEEGIEVRNKIYAYNGGNSDGIYGKKQYDIVYTSCT